MIDGLGSSAVALMDRKQADEYFDKFAGYVEDAPESAKYSIRVGAKFFHSADTMDLKWQFLRYWRTLRRRPICFKDRS